MATVAYFGIPGSYSYLAAQKYFADNDEFVSAKRSEDVFAMVKNERVEMGVVPIENSLDGSMYENYGLIADSGLCIVGEIFLKIEHCLLGVRSPGIIFDSLKKVFAHPQTLGQCTLFFEKHPTIEQVAYADDATAAQFVAEQKNPAFAAIAGKGVADIYALSIFAEDIVHNFPNYTRFFVLGREACDEGANKCSVAFSLPHVAGSLSNALKILSDCGMNLTKIESRPLYDGPVHYVFYADMEFSERYQRGVIGNQFKKAVENLKILGMYKAGHI